MNQIRVLQNTLGNHRIAGSFASGEWKCPFCRRVNDSPYLTCANVNTCETHMSAPKIIEFRTQQAQRFASEDKESARRRALGEMVLYDGGGRA